MAGGLVSDCQYSILTLLQYLSICIIELNIKIFIFHESCYHKSPVWFPCLAKTTLKWSTVDIRSYTLADMHLLFFLRWFSFGRNLNFHLGIESCLIYFPLVVRENLWQFVRYGHVKLVEGTSLEESAGALQRLEIIERVNIEEVSVGVWIW